MWVGSELRSFSGEGFFWGEVWAEGAGRGTELDWRWGGGGGGEGRAMGVSVVSVTPVCVSPSFGGPRRD